MDMMSIRRMVMFAMASGAEYITGTFTVPDDVTSYVLSFGKTFSKYIYYIEADDTSKTQILNSGYNSNKAFASVGVYPNADIGELDVRAGSTCRINPSTQSVANLTNPLASETYSDGTQLYFSVINLSDSGVYNLYRGLTYNYIVISLDNL